jgi:hypothetical protein
MLALNCKIKVGSFVFYSVSEVKIISTFRQFTDECYITLPRKVEWEGKNIHLGDEGLIKASDKVTVELGYDEDLKTEFSGYLRQVGSGFPIKLSCEDEMYKLKKETVSPKEFESAKLRDVLAYILPADILSNAKIDDINLGRFLIRDNVSVSKVIKEIKDQYHIFIFFRDGKLCAGRPVWTEYQKEHKFIFGHNIINDELKYIREEDVKLRVKAVSILEDSTKLEVEVGDKEGSLHTVKVNYVDNKSDLEKLANKRLEALKFTGMHGRFTAFGVPSVKQGDIANFTDELEDSDEREGRYRIDKVVKEFGVSAAYKQTIHIGAKM